MTEFYWLILLAAFVASAGITGLVRAYARRVDLLDVPNDRSSHDLATPRGGGLSIALTVLVALVFLHSRGDVESAIFWPLFLGSSAIAAIGFIDDHRHVPAIVRFSVHIVVAVAVTLVWGGFSSLQIGDTSLDLGFAGLVLSVGFIAWFVNAFNFMDGIDGIASVEAVTVAAAGAWLLAGGSTGEISGIAAVVAATTAGFLLWNWPPARIFMGDVGSGFLGFMLVAFALASHVTGGIEIWGWLILMGVFLVDATITLITRFIRGADWASAHRSHAYQKAARRWGSHLVVTSTVLAVNVVWLLPLAFLAVREPQNGWWLTAIAWAPLVVAALYIGSGRPD